MPRPASDAHIVWSSREPCRVIFLIAEAVNNAPVRQVDGTGAEWLTPANGCKIS